MVVLVMMEVPGHKSRHYERPVREKTEYRSS